MGQSSKFNIDGVSPRNLISERVSHAHRQMIVCQTLLSRKLSTAKAELDVLIKFNSSLTSAHDVATLRMAKELQRTLKSSMTEGDEANI